MNVSPTQSNALAALRSFLLAALPPGVLVIAAQDNRVPEPRESDFVVMTPLRFARLRTNVDSDADVKFTGSIAGTTMTVTAVAFGAIEVGAAVFGVGVAAGTVVDSLGTGTGGAGTYVVSPPQTLAERTLSSGAKTVEQGAMLDVQLDFHSASNAAANMAQTVSTLFRDEYAVAQFAEQDPTYGVVPLHADDPRQMPFVNDQQQYENRWVVEAHLQVNQVVSVPAQYADSINVDLVSVDAEYPP